MGYFPEFPEIQSRTVHASLVCWFDDPWIRLWSGAQDGEIRHWDLTAKKCIKKIKGNDFDNVSEGVQFRWLQIKGILAKLELPIPEPIKIAKKLMMDGSEV